MAQSSFSVIDMFKQTLPLPNIKAYLLEPRFHFNRLQFNLVALLFISAGIISGSYLTLQGITSIFATTSPWTQTNWNGGTTSGTVTGTVTTYESGSNITVSTIGEISLSPTSGWANDYVNWAKRQTVTITNSGSEQTNYQTKLSITYDSDMQTDFDDLRFTNSSGTALDYWTQSYTSSTNAIVWVEVDSLAANGDTTIYMYYGNSSASTSSNGDNTFILFDDFSSDTIDSNKWTISGSSSFFSVVSGELQIGEGNSGWNKSLYATNSITRSDLSFEMKYRWTRYLK